MHAQHAQVAKLSTSFIDIPGKIAVAIYFSGCSLRCKDCQNPHLWDPNYGEKFSIKKLLDQIDAHPIAESVVFLGGEPTDQIDFLQELCKKIKSKEKVLYTGREFEVLPTSLTDNLDMIICGPYKSELHVNRWPASSNQRVFIKKDNKWLQKNT